MNICAIWAFSIKKIAYLQTSQNCVVLHNPERACVAVLLKAYGNEPVVGFESEFIIESLSVFCLSYFSLTDSCYF